MQPMVNAMSLPGHLQSLFNRLLMDGRVRIEQEDNKLRAVLDFLAMKQALGADLNHYEVADADFRVTLTTEDIAILGEAYRRWSDECLDEFTLLKTKGEWSYFEGMSLDHPDDLAMEDRTASRRFFFRCYKSRLAPAWRALVKVRAYFRFLAGR